jgi:hypothetical protein
VATVAPTAAKKLTNFVRLTEASRQPNGARGRWFREMLSISGCLFTSYLDSPVEIMQEPGQSLHALHGANGDSGYGDGLPVQRQWLAACRLPRVPRCLAGRSAGHQEKIRKNNRLYVHRRRATGAADSLARRLQCSRHESIEFWTL